MRNTQMPDPCKVLDDLSEVSGAEYWESFPPVSTANQAGEAQRLGSRGRERRSEIERRPATAAAAAAGGS